MKHLNKFEGFFGDNITTGSVIPKTSNPHLSPEDLYDEVESTGVILDKKVVYHFKKIYQMVIQFEDGIGEINCDQDFYYNHKIGEEISIKRRISK